MVLKRRFDYCDAVPNCLRIKRSTLEHDAFCPTSSSYPNFEASQESMEVDSSDQSSQHYYHQSVPSCSTGMETYDNWQLPKIEEVHSTSDEKTLIQRFINVLDQLDNRVEKLRKDAFSLQEKREYLLMSVDLIKNNELLSGMDEYEREEIFCYISRVSARLSTVDLNVKTVRDSAQEDALHQVNMLIDTLITGRDAVTARQRCQTFLNACNDVSMMGTERVVDKIFEGALLGCTLDDQKTIKRRLNALMTYLNKQTVSA